MQRQVRFKVYQGVALRRLHRVLSSLTLIVLAAGCSTYHVCPTIGRPPMHLPPIPDSLGVAGAFAGVSNNALLVAGGTNFPEGMPWDGGKKVWHDTVYVLEDPAGQWKTAGKLPRPLAYGVSIQTRDGVLCVGGNDAARVYADVFVLSWKDGQLLTRMLPPLPVPTANACGARVSSRAIVTGGETAPNAVEAVSNCWSLNLHAVDRGWRELPACPGEGRVLAIAASARWEFYIVGGVSLSAGPDGTPLRRYLRDGYAIHPGIGKWRRITDMPHPLAAAPTPAPLNNAAKFIVFGGDDGSKCGFQPMQQHPGFLSDWLTYDVHTNAWSSLGHGVVTRVTLPVVSWRGHHVLPSGEVRPGVRSPEVLAY